MKHASQAFFHPKHTLEKQAIVSRQKNKPYCENNNRYYLNNVRPFLKNIGYRFYDILHNFLDPKHSVLRSTIYFYKQGFFYRYSAFYALLKLQFIINFANQFTFFYLHFLKIQTHII